MCLAQTRVYLQCQFLCRSRSGVALSRIESSVNGKHGHAVGQSGVGTRIAWVGFDSLLEIAKRLRHAFKGSLVPAVAALQVKLVGLRILGLAPCQPRLLLRCEPYAQSTGDLRGDFLLDGEDIPDLPFV